MTQQPSEPDASLWHRVAESYLALLTAQATYMEAKKQFLAQLPRSLGLLQRELRGGEWRVALVIAQDLAPVELVQLFPELVQRASRAHGAIGLVRELILRLPRDWVVVNIEAEAERELQEGTYDEYRRFLELYSELDRDLTLRLAQRAANHPDEDIREAGEEFLKQLGHPPQQE